MLPERVLIEKSLRFNLFSLRISKEHTFFIETALGKMSKHNFLPTQRQAHDLNDKFVKLLIEIIFLTDQAAISNILAFDGIVTDLTFAAEKATERLAGFSINTELTALELSLGTIHKVSQLIPMDKIYTLNKKALDLQEALAEFSTRLILNVLESNANVPHYSKLITHIYRETSFYSVELAKIQNELSVAPVNKIIDYLVFGNISMQEHLSLIKETLYPSEKQLIDSAGQLLKQLDDLNKLILPLKQDPFYLPAFTTWNIQTLNAIINFKRRLTKGILDRTIKTRMAPLFIDHFTREANYYLRILNSLIHCIEMRKT